MLYSIKRNKLNCAESGPSGMEFPNKWWTNEPMAPSASFNISYLHFDLYAKIFVSGLWHEACVCIKVDGHVDNIIWVIQIFFCHFDFVKMSWRHTTSDR